MFVTSGLNGGTGRAEIDLGDPELFPPAFFPGLADLSKDELLLAGVKSRYPERIRTGAPDPALPDPAPPVVRELETGGLYIRVKHLAEALPVIEEHLSEHLLMLDFRFLATDLESSLELASILTRRPTFELAVEGNYPPAEEWLADGVISVSGQRLRQAGQTVFTLTNHETRGPIEAVLAQLRNDGEIISVGAPSAGQTATFREFPGFDTFFLVSGEIRPMEGESLLESGFVPRVAVTVDPDADRLAYVSLRDDVELEDLVQSRETRPRRDPAGLLPGLPPNDRNDEENEVDLPRDVVLQRALNIVKALQALGRISG